MSDRQKTQRQQVQALNGSPTYLGTIAAGTASKTNGSTAAPFTLPAGGIIMIQPDAVVYVMPAKASGDATTVATAIKLNPDDRYYIHLKSDQAFVAAITASGTANLKVFRLE